MDTLDLFAEVPRKPPRTRFRFRLKQCRYCGLLFMPVDYIEARRDGYCRDRCREKDR